MLFHWQKFTMTVERAGRTAVCDAGRSGPRATDRVPGVSAKRRFAEGVASGSDDCDAMRGSFPLDVNLMAHFNPKFREVARRA